MPIINVTVSSALPLVGAPLGVFAPVIANLAVKTPLALPAAPGNPTLLGAQLRLATPLSVQGVPSAPIITLRPSLSTPLAHPTIARMTASLAEAVSTALALRGFPIFNRLDVKTPFTLLGTPGNPTLTTPLLHLAINTPLMLVVRAQLHYGSTLQPGFTAAQVNQLLRLWTLRGPSLIALIKSCVTLINSSPVDLSPVLGSVLLLAQGYSKAMTTILAYLMNDASFGGFSLDFEDQITQQAVLWQELVGTIGNLAFYSKLPNIQSITATSASARLLGAQGAATAVDLRLESFISVPTVAGVNVSRFWTITPEAVSALSRLLTIDYVLSSDPTVYYGPAGTTANILQDVLLILTSLAPTAPNTSALLTQINLAVAAGYREDTATSILAMRVSDKLDLQQLAYQVLGDTDLWESIASFNNLVYPYFSTDPVERLGPPDQTGHLVIDAHNGDTTLQVSGFGPFTADQRILLRCGNKYQVVTIIGGAFTSAEAPVDWDHLTNYLVSSEDFTVTIDQALTADYPALTTTVELLPAVYDAGIVLGIGDPLLIPTTVLQQKGFVVDTPLTDVDRYGTDLVLDPDGNLQIFEGDFETLTGQPNLVQAIKNKFKVTRGALVHHPSYGTGLKAFIGKVNRAYIDFLVITDAKQTVLSDPRISSLEDVAAFVNGDTVDLSFNAQASNGRLLFPVALELPIG